MSKDNTTEADKVLDIKEQEEKKPLTMEERVANLEGHMQQSIAVCNNLITYCNTIEKWRKMDFVPPKEEGSEESTSEEKPAEETNEEG